MADNWYKLSNNKSPAIPLDKSKRFDWLETINYQDSYSVVKIGASEKKFNFYFWSHKTPKTARKFYDNGNFKKSFNVLKRYCFDIQRAKK